MKTGIKITKVLYAGDYKLKIYFSDKKVNIFNYASLVTFDHEEFKIYRDINKFKKFRIIDSRTSIGWTKDAHLILPLHTLYSKKKVIMKNTIFRKRIRQSANLMNKI